MKDISQLLFKENNSDILKQLFLPDIWVSVVSISLQSLFFILIQSNYFIQSGSVFSHVIS